LHRVDTLADRMVRIDAVGDAHRPVRELRRGGKRHAECEGCAQCCGDCVFHVSFLLFSFSGMPRTSGCQPLSHCSGTSTSWGKRTSRNSTPTCAIRNGVTPVITFPRGTRATPLTTLRTMPTGGVIRPMQLFITNRTPK